MFSWKMLATNALVAIGYVLLAWAPTLVFAHNSPLWPPAAIAASGVLLWGVQIAPGIFIGSLSANLMLFGWSPAAALWISLGNTVAPLVSRLGLTAGQPFLAQAADRQWWSDPSLAARFLLWFGLVNGLIAGLFGASILATGQGPMVHIFLVTLGSWGVGNACATLMLSPALTMLWSAGIKGLIARARPWADTGWLFGSTLLIWALIFYTPDLAPPVRFGMLALFLLPSVWSLFRCETLITHMQLAFVFVLSLGATLSGHGPFGPTDPYLATVSIQLLGIGMASAVLMAGALNDQRARAIQELRVLNTSLEFRVLERAEALLRTERGFRNLLDTLPAPAIITEPDATNILYANVSAHDLFDGMHRSLSGLNMRALWADAGAREVILADVQRHGVVRNRELHFRRNGDDPMTVLASAIQSHFGSKDALVFVFKDISERTRREQEWRAQAETDALTRLYNRRYFDSEAQNLVREARSSQSPAALLLIDLDDFKKVNDTYGHLCGDRVLEAVAKLLRRWDRRVNLCARLGGEEFAIFLLGEHAQAPEALAEHIRADFSAMDSLPCGPDDRIAFPTVSIGIAVIDATGPGTDKEALSLFLRIADTALYQAKAAGKNQVVSLRVTDAVMAGAPELAAPE